MNLHWKENIMKRSWDTPPDVIIINPEVISLDSIGYYYEWVADYKQFESEEDTTEFIVKEIKK